jgi:CheY-like chemotaxis protein
VLSPAKVLAPGSKAPRVLVIHRKPEVAAERARRLSAEGLEAAAYPALGASAFRGIRANPPDAILIDLTELPSYGRAMAVQLREQKGTRNIPLVFLKGDPEKAARVREVLPDAVFANWPNVAPAIQRAIDHAARAPHEALVPNVAVPLAKKLRIAEGSVVALIEAPVDIRAILGALPKGARLESARLESSLRKTLADADVILCFVKSAAALGRALPHLASQMKAASQMKPSPRMKRTLWVCWPKRTSSMPCDLTLTAIRQMVSPYDMVDSKICAIDATWSGTIISLRRHRS